MNIIVPKFDGFTMGRRNRFMRELSWGNYVREYIAEEKATYLKRAHNVIKARKDHQQNNKSDFQLDFSVPAREYLRWLNEDKDFWKCNTNVKNYKRDNPECMPWKT